MEMIENNFNIEGIKINEKYTNQSLPCGRKKL
jgi:hypothetical protein